MKEEDLRLETVFTKMLVEIATFVEVKVYKLRSCQIPQQLELYNNVN